MVFRTFEELDFSQCPEEIRNALEFLKPVPSPWQFVRIGGQGDGAYLVPLELDGVSTCISPGVRNAKAFEDELATKFDIKSILVDYSSDIEKFSTPLIMGMQSFHKKWLGTRIDDTTITLESLLEAPEVSGRNDLMLQMDIEGAEWPILAEAKQDSLRRFRYIVMELHKLDDIFSDPLVFKGRVSRAFEKLQRSFSVIHAHPNNCCGVSENLYGTGMRIPRTLEVTLVNTAFLTNALKRGEAQDPELPHRLDVVRNVPGTPPVFLGNGWRSSKIRTDTLGRIILQALSYEFLWRWKKLIPRRLYRAMRKIISS